VSFAAPLWLAAGAAAVVLAALLWRAADRRRRADLERFAAGRLLGELTANVSWTRRRAKRALVAAGVALAFVALARPQVGFDWEETHRRGIDVMIALDVSRSMLAEDVVPNRLERAKLGVVDLMERTGGDRLGLIAFAGTAFLQCPLTLDHDAFREALDALEPGIIPAPGTDLASALRVARDAFRTEAKNVKLLVVLSDGEDLRGDALAAAREVAADGVRVYTVGVGTPAGELIPIRGRGGRTDFVKDPSGQIVRSRLDEETLRKVAEATGGFYVPLGQRAEGITAIDERALAPIPKQDLASRMRRVPKERYQWPLAAALLCLLLEPLLGERRGRRAWRAWPGRRAAAAATGAAVVLLAAAAHASPQSAARLYDAGKYEEALQEYRAAAEASPGDQRIDLNHGTAAYRTGAFDEAAGAFSRALGSDDPALQERSFYNLGNTQFRLGQKTRTTNPQQTIAAWRQALDAYDAALKLDGKDADARFNRDLVAKELEKLQQEQKKQQSRNDQQQDQQKDQQKEDQQQQQSRQGSGQQKQDRQGQQQAEPQPGQDQKDQKDQKDRQGGQPQEPQEQQEQARQQAGGQGEPREQQAKNEPAGGGEKPSPEKPDHAAEPVPPDATPKAANQQQAQAGGEPGAETADAGAPAAPGMLDPREARALLDSLRGDERSMPVARPRPPRDADTARDW
jgi:Ca-activated chloride channel family protein